MQQDLLVNAILEQEPPAGDVHDAARRRALAEVGQRAIREVRREVDIVVTHVRRQQRRLRSADAQDPPRQQASVVVKDAVVATVDVAVVVRYDERIRMLECEKAQRAVGVGDLGVVVGPDVGACADVHGECAFMSVASRRSWARTAL